MAASVHHLSSSEPRVRVLVDGVEEVVEAMFHELCDLFPEDGPIEYAFWKDVTARCAVSLRRQLPLP